jgi:predicted phage terminase large subunit-like protein
MTIKPPDFSTRFASALRGDWRARARPAQLPPDDFSIWLFLAGRGSGKNWADSHYVQEQGALGAVERIALIGATADSVRQTMVEGAAGILAAAGDVDRPIYEPSKGQLTWASGTTALMYSADSPELLRGPEFGLAWCDELASWRRDRETWDNLAFCMRGSKNPRIIISTTPKPTKLIKELVARAGKDGVVITRSSTYDNRQNLPPSFFSHLVKKYEGTRTGRQELLAELLLDTPGALWSAENLETTRVEHAPHDLVRVVVAIDPSGSGDEGADEAGIIVAGLGADSNCYVLADLSGRMSPTEWARKAIDAYRVFKADRIIAETNFGAQMVIATISAVDSGVPTKAITSSRGKVLRAEPISTTFEQGRAHLVGNFPELEDQLTSFTSDYDRTRDGSPDPCAAGIVVSSVLTAGVFSIAFS